jgi:hypothetical protein
MNIQDLLHKRILLAEKTSRYNQEKIVKEFKILEISPSGNWVKVQNDFGKKYWVPTIEIIPIEVLANQQIKGI